MDAQTANLLLQINQEFYTTFADQFSATRQRLQPGVLRALKTIPKAAQILDLGCGNGELACVLAESGHTGDYTGLDFSTHLLQEARKRTPPDFPARFHQADLTTEWTALWAEAEFDFVLAFAVLHHIPGAANRRRLLENVSKVLKPDGRFVHSNWQFLQSPRLRARIQPWARLNIPPEALEPGDYLLDWRRGGYGLRYVHHFSASELHDLAEQAGFRVMESYSADGATGRLSLYQIWSKRNHAYPLRGATPE